MLKQVSPALPRLWEQGVLCWSQKKALLHSFVDKVVLRREGDRVTMRVVWRGGDATESVTPVTVGRFEQLTGAEEIEQTILAMARQRRTDKEIADHLTSSGHRSPRAGCFLPSTVARIRMQHGILYQEGPSHPHVIPGYLRAHQLAKRLGIKPHWIYDRIRSGVIKVDKDAKHNAYLFPDQPETLQQLRQLAAGKTQTLAY